MADASPISSEIEPPVQRRVSRRKKGNEKYRSGIVIESEPGDFVLGESGSGST
jgi:hypothetical protein